MNTAKLKGKLKELDITQAEFAEMIGVHPSTINRKLNEECGESFTIGEALKIKEVLHLTPEESSIIFLP